MVCSDLLTPVWLSENLYTREEAPLSADISSGLWNALLCFQVIPKDSWAPALRDSRQS